MAKKILEFNRDSSKLFITSAAGLTRSNRDGYFFPDNNHEEADTLMIYLATTSAARHSIEAQMTFFSPDTDVFVLVIANYDRLPKNTYISMASGVHKVETFWTAIGVNRARALPGLHAFTGTDNTGRFARISKSTWFKLFMEAEDEMIEALHTLCYDRDTHVNEDLHLNLAKFVCAAYQSKGLQFSSIPELRWYLFCKHMTESERLPPTPGALRQHILRARVQATIWGQATVPQQEQLDPLKNGYHRDTHDGNLKPITGRCSTSS